MSERERNRRAARPEPATRAYAAGELARVLDEEPTRAVALPQRELRQGDATQPVGRPESTAARTTFWRPTSIRSDASSAGGEQRPAAEFRVAWSARYSRLLALGLALASIALLLAIMHPLWRSPPSAPSVTRAARTSIALAPGVARHNQRASADRPSAEAKAASRPGARATMPPVRLDSITATPATAVAELAAGHYREALRLYRALGERWPEQAAYDVVARLLERKLAARCRALTEAGAAACSEAP